MALKSAVICRHRCTPEATRIMRYCKLKSAQVVNLGAGMHLTTDDRYEGVKKGFYQETKHSSDVFWH